MRFLRQFIQPYRFFISTLVVITGLCEPTFSQISEANPAMLIDSKGSATTQLLNQLPDSAKTSVLNQINSRSSVEVKGVNNGTPQAQNESSRPNDTAASAGTQQLSPIEASYSDNSATPEKRALIYSPLINSKSESRIERIPLQQYGYSVFKTIGGATNAYVNTPTNPDYILGPGDALLIRVWGKIEEQFSVTIDNNGQIFLPKVGVVNVAGVSYGAIGGVIKRELSKFYVNFQVSVTIGSMRSIKVFVLGEAGRPGAYDMPAKATLMGVLYSAGGPLKTGSMRKIQLIRNKHVVKTIDLYDYLMSGDQSQDPVLQNFDTIFIPLIGHTVKVEGTVKRPGIYEISGDETVYDAVQTLAGGAGASYYGKRVQVERIVEGQKRIMVDVDVSDPSKFKVDLKSEKLKNGDCVTVFPIPNKRFNEVYIQGNVVRSGTYEYSHGMTLGDLIRKADGLLKDTYLQRIEIYRSKSGTEKQIIPVDYSATESSKIRLSEFDVVNVNSKADIDGPKRVSSNGAVEVSGAFTLLENMKVLDLIYLTKPNDTADLQNAELVRQVKDKSIRTIKVNIAELLSNPKSDNNILLEDRDQLFVRVDTKKADNRTIYIHGEVKHPGAYQVRPGETLSDALRRAGGITQKGFLPGLVFSRASIKAEQESALNRISKDEQKLFLFDSVRIKTLESNGYNQAYLDSIKSINSPIQPSERGRIVLGITSLTDITHQQDIELLDKDDIYIPEKQTIVQVMGGVQNPTTLIFYENTRVIDYVTQCGGYTRFARLDDLVVFRANGIAIRNGGDNIQIQPGDTIYIPEEVKIPFDWAGSAFEFAKFFVNIATGWAIVNSLL